LGIRADFNPGPISIEEMFNVFPFENTIATLNLSGSEVQELFDFVVERSAGRGCNTQAQIAGAAVVLDCGDVCPQERVQADGSCGACPSNYLRENGECFVEPHPRARRILIDDASPPPSGSCVALQEDYNECCEVVARCGCMNDDCTESICEDRARADHGGCDTAYEPSYSTDPCADDAECMSRGANQRCFVVAGREQGRCMYTVVDNYELLDPYGAYQLAANDYIARGGSGFRVLGRNTSQNDLGIPLRDVLVDHIRQGQPCTDNARCSTDGDCLQGETCACEARARWESEAGICSSEHDQPPECDNGSGRCVLANCVEDVAAFRAARVTTCHDSDSDRHRDECLCDARRWAARECEVLPCIDEALGAGTDGRQTMVQP
jgi:5'-nucleotidase